MSESAGRWRQARAGLLRGLHRLQSIRMRVAISAAVVASLALFGGMAWLRGTVYEQHMRAERVLASACASTLRLRLLRLPDGSGGVEYRVQPLMRCQPVAEPGGDRDWIGTPFEIVDSAGRSLDSDPCLRPSSGEAGKASGSQPPSARLPAPAVPDGDGQRAGDRVSRTEVVRLGLATGSPGCPPGRRHLAYTQTVVLTDASLDTTEIVDGLREPDKYFGSWRPGAPAYAVKVYVLTSPRQAEEAVGAIDLLMRPGLPITVLVIAAVAWSAADQALRIVERMRAQVAAISAIGLEQRLAVPDSNDQIARLATTLNDTLDRIEDSMRRQRQFVADAAHELRNPIGSIRAMLELARDHPDRVDHASVITETAGETRRLQRLAEDLLLLARLESAATTASQPVDLAALAAAQVADRGRTGTVRVTFQPPPAGASEPVSTPGRELELDRLLSNLLDNAERHATAHVGVTIESDLDDSRFLLLMVDDDGPGIPPSDRERIFDRFARLDEARARHQGGAGLGLAIARGICHGHHGTLTATSSPSGGARFVVRLRRAD